jgi:hypothetical protein
MNKKLIAILLCCAIIAVEASCSNSYSLNGGKIGYPWDGIIISSNFENALFKNCIVGSKVSICTTVPIDCNVEGFWIPDISNVLIAEASIRKYIHSRSVLAGIVEYYDFYKRQYLGIITNNRKCILINMFISRYSDNILYLSAYRMKDAAIECNQLVWNSDTGLDNVWLLYSMDDDNIMDIHVEGTINGPTVK